MVILKCFLQTTKRHIRPKAWRELSLAVGSDYTLPIGGTGIQWDGHGVLGGGRRRGARSLIYLHCRAIGTAWTVPFFKRNLLNFFHRIKQCSLLASYTPQYPLDVEEDGSNIHLNHLVPRTGAQRLRCRQLWAHWHLESGSPEKMRGRVSLRCVCGRVQEWVQALSHGNFAPRLRGAWPEERLTVECALGCWCAGRRLASFIRHTHKEHECKKYSIHVKHDRLVSWFLHCLYEEWKLLSYANNNENVLLIPFGWVHVPSLGVPCMTRDVCLSWIDAGLYNKEVGV